MPSILTTIRTLPLPTLTSPLPFLSQLRTRWEITPNRPLLTGLTTLAITLPAFLYLLLPSVTSSYRTYMSMGPGGLPHNVWGFLLQSCMWLVARRDVRAVPPPYYHHHHRQRGAKGSTAGGVEDSEEVVIDPAVLAKYAPHGQTSFLTGDGSDTTISNEQQGLLPLRRGARPSIPPIVAPQRQVSEPATGEMIAHMEGFLLSLAGVNISVLEIRPSMLEGKLHQAVFLRDQDKVPGFMGRAKGEIVHVHGEGSSHMTVSLVDGEEAVAKGWAERHPLSGGMLPWSYVMVYAPRDDEEYAIWKRLVVAACKFVSGGKDIKMSEV